VAHEPKLRLSPWYINTRRIALLTDSELGSAAQRSLVVNSDERVAGMRQAARLADKVAKSGDIPNLTRQIIAHGIPGDRMLASIWGVFTFRGLGAALAAEERGMQVKAGTFSGRIPIGPQDFAFEGVLSNDHIYSSTSVIPLTGRRRAFVLGQFEFRNRKVEVFPYIIGDFAADLGRIGLLPHGWPNTARIYPSMIGAFEKIDSVESPTAAQLRAMLDLPEDDVRNAMAEIIGEPFEPKHWGGEKSDLYTSRLTIDGKPISAAFILKGPGAPGPMYPATLGKRGDQLVRAFDEPADLIVIQHHSQVTNAVIRQAEAFAANPSNPRLYCIIDGADTWRILKAYGRLKAQSAGRRHR
jgi:hypothetical protein